MFLFTYFLNVIFRIDKSSRSITSVRSSVCPPVRPSFGPFVHPSVRHSVRHSVRLSVRHSIRQSARHSACHSTRHSLHNLPNRWRYWLLTIKFTIDKLGCSKVKFTNAGENQKEFKPCMRIKHICLKTKPLEIWNYSEWIRITKIKQIMIWVPKVPKTCMCMRISHIF